MAIPTYNVNGRSVVSKNVVLEIAKLYNNPDSTVRIYSNTEGAQFRFKAFIEQGMQFSLSNTWEGALQGSVASEALSKVNSWVKTGQVAVNALGMTQLAKALGSTGVRSVHETLKSYSSSTPPTFSCQCVLMSYDHSIDIVSSVTNLASMCLPYKQGNLAYMAPLRYQPVLSSLNLDDLVEFANNKEQDFSRKTAPLNAGPGTLNVAIQRNFFGAGLLADSLQYSFSKEVVEDGSPLFATVTFAFSPKIAPDFYQYRQYFKGYRSETFADGAKAVLDPSFAAIEASFGLLKTGLQKGLEATGIDQTAGFGLQGLLQGVADGANAGKNAIGDNTNIKQ